MTKNYTVIIFGVAIILASYILGNAFSSRNQAQGTISVTGLGKKDFVSDLVVWEARFTTEGEDLKQAYLQLETDKKIINNYLKTRVITENIIVFTAVKSNLKTKANYSASGEFIGNEFISYELIQAVQIESKEVEKIEKISREITELLNQGVKLYSEPPRYYYTKLADLKIEMISKATEDARIRATKIAEFSGSDLGDLISAKMGVFQITGQNSKENYSWGGTHNTSSKEKTASITMKLVFEVDK